MLVGLFMSVGPSSKSIERNDAVNFVEFIA